MKDIFHYSPNLYIHTPYFENLKAFGANIWNKLPEHSKSTTSLLEFKKSVKTWPGPRCKCSVCK